jgi:cell division septum initiation protein DivIVA
MRVMEITARELRDIEIREAFRGYNRDDVNDLLERAAVTIDAAAEKLRQMTERLSSAQQDSGRSRETEDILHRTLLLAQRAADEAVAEAQVKSRQLMEEAETQSRRAVAEAETEARVRGEGERRRLEQEVLELASRRDMLTSDIEVLTRYETEYRDRLLRALETDLDTLKSRPAVAPGPRPEIKEIELPVERERVLRRDEAAPATREIDMRALVEEETSISLPASEPSIPAMPQTSTSSGSGLSSGSGSGSGSGGGSGSGSSAMPPPPMPVPSMASPGSSSNGSPSASLATAPRAETRQNGTANGRSAVATEERTRPPRPAPIDLLAAEGSMDAEVLDDEAFFATLREAVHDDAPLGPREEEDQSTLFDQDDEAEEEASFKDVFRRRR